MTNRQIHARLLLLRIEFFFQVHSMPQLHFCYQYNKLHKASCDQPLYRNKDFLPGILKESVRPWPCWRPWKFWMIYRNDHGSCLCDLNFSKKLPGLDTLKFPWFYNLFAKMSVARPAKPGKQRFPPICPIFIWRHTANCAVTFFPCYWTYLYFRRNNFHSHFSATDKHIVERDWPCIEYESQRISACRYGNVIQSGHVFFQLQKSFSSTETCCGGTSDKAVHNFRLFCMSFLRFRKCLSKIL